MKPQAFVYLVALTLFSTYDLVAQRDGLTIAGRIIDKETSLPLEYATVTIRNSQIGVISNAQGEFEFHIPERHIHDSLYVSMLGYVPYTARAETLSGNITVMLVPKTIMLSEVVVEGKELTAEEIVKKAVQNIPVNYPSKPFMMEGFFRQVQKIDNKYVSVLEAAVDISDPGYTARALEKAGIVEMRRSHYFNAKPYYNIADTFYTQKHNSLGSTLAFNTIRDLASTKLPGRLFYDGKFDYTLDSTLIYGGQAVYVINAVQRANKGYMKDPLKEVRTNTLMIDAETFGIIRIIFDYKPKDNHNLATDFKNVTKTVDSVVSVVSAHRHVYEFGNYNGVLYLKYITWSDWVLDYNLKRKSVSHLNEYRHELLINHVITDPKEFHAVKENMKPNQSLHLQASPYNEAFWKNYNVIYESAKERRQLSELLERIDKGTKSR